MVHHDLLNTNSWQIYWIVEKPSLTENSPITCCKCWYCSGSLRATDEHKHLLPSPACTCSELLWAEERRSIPLRPGGPPAPSSPTPSLWTFLILLSSVQYITSRQPASAAHNYVVSTTPHSTPYTLYFFILVELHNTNIITKMGLSCLSLQHLVSVWWSGLVWCQ